MVNMNNTTTATARLTRTRGSHPLGGFPATPGKAPIYSQKFGEKSVWRFET